MKKYQITDCGAAFGYAGSKATQDVAYIAGEMGFQPCLLKMRTVKDSKAAKLHRQAGYYIDWKRCCREIEDGSLVLLQHPFHYPQLIRESCLRRLKKKNVRFLCMVHDVEELRGYRFGDYYKKEFEFMLEIGDVFVVHNQAMKSFFTERGVREEALVELEIFDYLQNLPPKTPAGYDKRVIIAGNLDTRKSGYIKELKKLESVSFDLYGGGYNEGLKKDKNISYCGTFSPDSPAEYLNRGVGLVWDGSSLSGCTGSAGEYLRYNNPHKLSLYLSCGLPVIIWEKAAEAAFVREKGVGLCVGSLWEMEEALRRLDEASYRRMADNAWETGRRLLAGAYTRQAITKACMILQGREEKSR